MSEKTAIYVTIDGERLRIVLPGEGWTSEEAKLAKTVTGMAPITVEENLMLQDPDAWEALLRVSYLRAGREFPPTVFAKANLMELMGALTAALVEASKDLPPTKANGSEPSEPVAQSENEPSKAPSLGTTT